jgi:3-deoxy-7-phosphoheptulonate synthase
MFSVSEVFDTHHLKYARDIDVLQVGARAMFNTELLKALGRVKKPVILKKFYGSTLDEYLKMVDYVVKSGNDKVILCERGVDSKYTQTRYSLDPYLVYKMKEYGLPVCVDISHPAGDRSIIGFFSRIAVASEADIIMVEVHNDPINSLSDSAQAISLQTFETIYSNAMKYKNLMDTIETYG